MKKKDIDLSMLEHAGNDIIDELVPFSSESERIKKRAFSMSEKKFRDMSENFESSSNNTVRGVETYHRPVWYRPLCAAAAVAIIAGGAGTFRLLKNGGSGSSIVPASEINEPQENEVVEPYEAETTAEVSTAVEYAPPTEEEMKALFDEYFPVFIEALYFDASDRIDPEGKNADSVTLLMYYNDKSFFAEGGDTTGLTEVGDSYYSPETYYKLNDPRFSSIEELRDYYGKYFTNVDDYLYIGTDLSEYNDGDLVISEDQSHPWIIEYRGDLYALRHLKPSLTADMWDEEVLSDKSFYVSGTSFTWERISKIYEEGIGQEAIGADLNFVRDDEGNWKLENGDLPVERYHINKDYAACDVPMIEDFYQVVDEQMILDNACAYARDFCGVENSDNAIRSYETVNELPENYYHVTDEFVNNSNWYKVYFNTDDDAILGPLALYLDENGTVFGTDIRE